MSSVIHINGQPLRMITYDGKLYRGNVNYSSKNKANAHYGNRYNKFFGLSTKEVMYYIENKEKAYVKQWVPIEPLFLIDILEDTTRHSLEVLIDAKEALDISFPVVNNKVYRVSEQVTQLADNEVLAKICTLHDENGRNIDGYYMERQQNSIVLESGKRIKEFHAEIGLCKQALKKLKLHTTNTYKRGKLNTTKTTRGRSGSFNNTLSPLTNEQKEQVMKPISPSKNQTKKASRAPPKAPSKTLKKSRE